ncbi:4Fe-4S binding protein [Acetivibrio ethanolgignens]|uniref:4Fe-4S ferredoxin-type domain-containing protein n=1 Tax=Acetivibrio ethanolgignens TaxID=290052 RepID=A0A0V8QHG6_9FIRM|nr:4Fe-4S binding protein [Acetivibrio ethanolgignens]KSV59513.1 hypothetical protein ASU35_08365 [Acetivibrio ethanolgignens]
MKKRAIINKKRCVACGACSNVCPKQAITIYKGIYAQISEMCVGCGLCTRTCPASAVSLEVIHEEKEALE